MLDEAAFFSRLLWLDLQQAQDRDGCCTPNKLAMPRILLIERQGNALLPSGMQLGSCWPAGMDEHPIETSVLQQQAGSQPATVHSHSKYVLSSEDVAKAQGELQQQLHQLGIAIPDVVTIQRFYRATTGNYKLAIKRLVSTAKWRHQKQPEHMTCSTCARNKHAHFMHPVGFDRLGRPVLFTSYVMVQEAALHGNIEHMISEFERAVRIMDSKHQGAESWHWIMDFRGFGRRLNDLNPALPLAFLDVSANHYPERLGDLLIIDAPSILTPLWNMLRPLMDPVTHDKIKFLPYDIPSDLQLVVPSTSQPATLDAVVTSGAAPQAEKSVSAAPDAALPATPAQQQAAHATEHAASEQQQAGDGKQRAGKHSKLLAELQRLADDEMVNWIVQELHIIRAWDAQSHKSWGRSSKQGTQVQRPCWDVELLHKAVTAGQLELLPTDAATGHCHYGTASFLNHMLTCPEVLLPPSAASSTTTVQP